jgi:hypothetical protein
MRSKIIAYTNIELFFDTVIGFLWDSGDIDEFLFVVGNINPLCRIFRHYEDGAASIMVRHFVSPLEA